MTACAIDPFRFWCCCLPLLLHRAPERFPGMETSSGIKGAAEEGPPSAATASSSSSSSSSTPASYDPRVYQPPHPDDRSGRADGKPSSKKGGGAKAKAKTEGGADGKGNDGDDGTHRCGNCDAPDAKRKCTRCCVEYYCNRECQKVWRRR